VFGGGVTADGAAALWVAVAGGGEEHHKDGAVDFGDHQPVRGRFGGLEHRVGCPDVVDVLDAQAWVFEQVGGLGIDLKWVLVVEQIEIEPVVHRPDNCNTNGYKLWWPGTRVGFASVAR